MALAVKIMTQRAWRQINFVQDRCFLLLVTFFAKVAALFLFFATLWKV